MTDAANASTEAKKEEKEADHHPYRRPVDAATLILVDRTASIPKVLVGKRHDKVVFMPGKFVFPGGRVDKSDNRVPVAAPIPQALEANLLKGSPKITPSRAAMACALSIVSSGVTHTGHPGPCTSSIPSGRSRSMPCFTIEWVWPPQTSIITQGRV